MKFDELVERFFKQYHTSLGIDLYLRASFKSKIETSTNMQSGKPAKDANGELVYMDIVSDPMPFDLPPKEARAYGEGTPLDKHFRDSMERYEVEYSFEKDEEIIAIKMAMESEKYLVHDAIVTIESKQSKYWNPNKSIVFPDQILCSIAEWLGDRANEGLESTMSGEVLANLNNELKPIRNAIYERLISAIKGEDITRENLETTNTVNSEQPSDEPFDNKFDNNLEEELYDHFKVLVPKHLSKEDLTRYIWGAFHHQKKCNSFTFKNFDNKKGHIQDVWVQYYKKSPDSHANKELFIPLLSDYFKEFDTEKMLAELEENKSNFK